MGEARTRRLAMARREPLPQDRHRCPACFGRRTVIETMPAKLAMSHIETRVGVCADCKTFWEAYPDDWSHDVCEGEPCDNCAFRPESPEIQDRAEWRKLLADLKGGREFKCHKGAPIILGPNGEIGFDEAWVQRYGRTCAGFHRAIMTRPGWLEARYPGLADTLAEPDPLRVGSAHSATAEQTKNG